VFTAIFALAFPLFSDKRLLLSYIILFLISFSGIFVYYMFKVNTIITMADKEDEESRKNLRKNFSECAHLTMYANIIYLVMIYVPLFFLMYFMYGYTKLILAAFFFIQSRTVTGAIDVRIADSFSYLKPSRR